MKNLDFKLKFVMTLSLSLLIGACASKPVAEKRKVPVKESPHKSKPTSRAQFEAAKKESEAGKKSMALKRLQQIVKDEPQSDIYDDAAFLMGQIYFQNKEYAEAMSSFSLIFDSKIASPLEGDAYYNAGMSAQMLNKPELVKKYYDLALAHPTLNATKKTELLKAKMDALDAGSGALLSLNEYVKLSSQTQDSNLRETYHLKMADIVNTRLNEQEIEKVASSSEYGTLRGNAYYRLGEMALARRDLSAARSAFSEVTSHAPNSNLSERAEHYVSQIEASRRVDTKTIGVVLPMTGRHAAISQKALRGIEMGLGLHTNIPSQFKIAVIDSEANPEGARRAVERLVTEDNAVAIVGSVLSKTATAVAHKAQEMGVPSIALSQKAGITEVGPSVFRNALTNEMQIRYLVRMAMEDMGYKRFAVIYPNDNYGVELTNLFWDEVLARGGTIVAAQIYHPKENDFTEVVQRLVGTYYPEDRREELSLRLKKQKQDNVKKSVRKEQNVADLLPGIGDFDAVFIPDTVRALGLIAPTLAYNGVTKVKFLGTNIWNNPQLTKRIGKYGEQVLFVDGYSPLDPRAANARFVQEYKALFNEEPGNFEFQGYDTALMIRQAILQGADSREALQRKLANLHEFPASLGPLYVTADREIQRPMVALSVKNGEIRPLTIQEKKH